MAPIVSRFWVSSRVRGAQARGGRGGFAAGMSTPHHDDVEPPVITPLATRSEPKMFHVKH